MSLIVEATRSFSFQNKFWNKTGNVVECPPGTWCKPYKGAPPDWAALYCCPNCKQPSAISALVHKIDARGKLNKELTCPKCKWTANAILNSWGKQTLYAIAYEQNEKPRVIIKSGDSVQEVKREFVMAYPQKDIRIVAIGEVLGYYSEDRDDKILATS